MLLFTALIILVKVHCNDGLEACISLLLFFCLLFQDHMYFVEIIECVSHPVMHKYVFICGVAFPLSHLLCVYWAFPYMNSHYCHHSIPMKAWPLLLVSRYQILGIAVTDASNFPRNCGLSQTLMPLLLPWITLGATTLSIQ